MNKYLKGNHLIGVIIGFVGYSFWQKKAGK
jgi:hypothetical protein